MSVQRDLPPQHTHHQGGRKVLVLLGKLGSKCRVEQLVAMLLTLTDGGQNLECDTPGGAQLCRIRLRRTRGHCLRFPPRSSGFAAL